MQHKAYNDVKFCSEQGTYPAYTTCRQLELESVAHLRLGTRFMQSGRRFKLE